MPSKNTIKNYVDGGYYHIYNRGVNKMNIFTEEQDYRVFLSYLKTYLLPKDSQKLIAAISNPEISYKEKDDALRQLHLNNFHTNIDLLAYCLMPNHFHLLIKQKSSQDLELFMRSLMTRFSQYFNKRHRRIGPIYQGRYKGILVKTDPQLLYLTRYIHRNPLDLKQKRTIPIKKALKSQPSSYPVYIKEIKQAWVKAKFILQNFSQSGYNSYKSFVESEDDSLEEQTLITISNVSIDIHKERTVLYRTVL